MLQFITDNKSATPAEEQVKTVLSEGCGWIVVDTKDISDDRLKEIISSIMPLCLEKEVFLLLCDKVELAKEINVGGVVITLGSGIFPSHARATLGAAAVIGVEVNTIDQIAALKGLDVDYVVMTPYRSSDDLEQPILGIEGVKKLCDYMKSEDIELPRVSAGGVMADDVKSLIDAGCNGVATSDLKAFKK